MNRLAALALLSAFLALPAFAQATPPAAPAAAAPLVAADVTPPAPPADGPYMTFIATATKDQETGHVDGTLDVALATRLGSRLSLGGMTVLWQRGGSSAIGIGPYVQDDVYHFKRGAFTVGGDLAAYVGGSVTPNTGAKMQADFRAGPSYYFKGGATASVLLAIQRSVGDPTAPPVQQAGLFAAFSIPIGK